MTEWKYRNGYVEIYEDGIFVGNYDTIEEYHDEKKKERTGRRGWINLFFMSIRFSIENYKILCWQTGKYMVK